MYADLHCHSFLRPFERTDITANPPVMSGNPCDDTSVWHIAREAGDLADIEHQLGFIGYTQSDFTQVAGNNSAVVVVSLFAVENGFFELRKSIASAILGALGIKDFLERFLGMVISKFNIDDIRDVQLNVLTYKEVLDRSVAFMINGQTTTVDLSGCAQADYTSLQGRGYELIKPGTAAMPGANDLKVLWSIEGGNCLWSAVQVTADDMWDGRNFETKNGLKDATAKYNPLPQFGADYRSHITVDAINNKQLAQLIPWAACDQLVANVADLKNLEFRPFFITLGHHFYNGIVGHPSSLQPLTDLKLLDQSFGCNSDITNAGWCVINEMLREPAKRILVDVKHMSIIARQSYYTFRRNNYPDVPVVFSHGSVYGASLKNGIYTSNADIIPSPDGMAINFYHHDINLFDEDIMEITLSGGLIGLEFDQRVNGVKGEHPDNKMPEMIWHNIRYIAEVAVNYVQEGQSVWGFISLGTDFDGIINPMDKGQTAGMINDLRAYIKSFLSGYLMTPNPLRYEDNAMDIETVLDKIFFQNIIDFAGKYYV